MRTEYQYHAKYKTTDGYTHYAELKAMSKEDAIKEANLLQNLKTLYEIFRRANKIERRKEK